MVFPSLSFQPSDSQNTGDQKAETKECVGGEQGFQAKVSEVNDKEQKPTKKQKHVGNVTEDVKETESQETVVDQGQLTATAASGGSHGNMEAEAAGKATLKKKKSKKVQSNEATEAVSGVVKGPSKKKSKKATDDDQKVCTAEMLVDSERETAEKYDKCESQDNADEGCVESEVQSSKKKRKHNSAATQDDQNISGQDGCCGNIEAPAKGEDGTTAVLRNVKKKGKNSLKMESVEVSEAMSNVLEEPPKKKSKKVKTTDNNGSQQVTISSAASQLNPESKVAKSQDNTSSEGGVVIEKVSSQTSKKKRKHD